MDKKYVDFQLNMKKCVLPFGDILCMNNVSQFNPTVREVD